MTSVSIIGTTLLLAGALLLYGIVRTVWEWLSKTEGEGRPTVYSLDHARLNVQLPPEKMWMNMGYWKVCVYIQLTVSNLMVNLE
jgi:hypothetical protein